ncbi:hypothetical protein [Alkalihalobacterium alkalinitrilicum]|uniref:hypothetical protein n=1 Tax=Alkalihalobacterium alkalinitrilicum TaxID=427920 RepID=UPI000994AED4|nr:hypothetical protein [Alkalihalobacterium alkalinitrilicum]
MSKKQKILFRISIAVNILLVIVVAWGYIKINFASEQIFLTEVQHNLVELEGLIANQSDDNWSEPNLVTTQLGDILNGIWLGMTTGEQLSTLSRSDKEILHNLYYKLKQYPNDKLYSFAELSQEDQENFEELQQMLRDAGLGLNIQVSANMNYFMNQAEKLEKNIEASLN